MSNNVSIPRPPDVVTILWERNPLNQRAPRTIVEATVIGSAAPCNRFLGSGESLARAENCLLDNGFKRISEDRLGVFGVSVFVWEDC
ncbi:hypothetical protein [Alkalihalobacillus sp. AL-G]|uniref:hypothetical protein n=1 Tax=Alkalihalobacillus sp. AL-G TaxID=2926399 RepID=UPI00272966CA|nr:hypothetical protein [Alkalihalobacillus sp. AL-G]WLD94419.1 hypothetical protein MOJ78_05895 [Alkalihalobacillus sp. AL-G]